MEMNLKNFGFREGYKIEDRVIKQEVIEFEGVEYYISTVDLGLDHSFGDGLPIYWETMIFYNNGEYRDLYCDRYTSKEEAQESHDLLVKDILAGKYKITDGYFERTEE